MPEPLSTVPKTYGNFELKCSLNANEIIPVHKYVSNQTGLTVVVSEVDGPLVNGYFCLATEAHDDDGLPHTLEHLIFLGSDKYPFKGVLDLLANRCLASGTNAWTDTDHTCYTMQTAGSSGFLSLMPIYLDHVLYPTLTDSGFITEVYHVNGEGKDGGVVFTEMQGTENTGESLVGYELVTLMYPGHCGYKSKTGGAMKNLRESTSNEKVRAYHKQFYRPENLYVIVVGSINPEEVLKALGPVEESIISKGDRGDFERPWQKPVPPLLGPSDILVPFPCDEEDNGMVYIGWRGPSAVKDYYRFSACNILLKYMTDTSVSPLPKEFVDIPDPYASKVSYTPYENAESLMVLTFDNVPKEKLSSVKPKLEKVLQEIVASEKPFDMKRLATVINRQRLEALSNLENAPHDTIAFTVIGYMLYGNSIEDFDQRLNYVKELDRMEKEPLEFWVNLLKDIFVTGTSVTVRGCPSIEEQKRLTKEEDDRVAKRVAELGREKLAEKERIIADAMTRNEIPPPDAMLTSVPIPSTDSIKFHSINVFTSDSDKQDPRFNTKEVPLYVQLDHLKTNFVYLFALMDSGSLRSDLRPYLPLLLNLVLESPIRRDGEIVSYEDVVHQLEEDTLAASSRVGPTSSGRFNCGPFPQTSCLLLQLEPKKYLKGIDWIREILYSTVLTADRVKIIANKILNNIPEVKRNGNGMVYELMKGLMYDKESNHHAVSALYQQKFLAGLIEEMNTPEGAAKVVKELENVRAILTKPENLVLHIAANLNILESLYPSLTLPLVNIIPKEMSAVKTKLKVTPDWKLLQEKMGDESAVTGAGAVESTYLCQTTPSIQDFNDPDLATLLVFFQYLTQLEGPMWRQIRGQGLAYSYNIVPRPNEGKLYLTLYRASNVVGAYKEAKSVIEERLQDNATWDQTLFEAAKSSLIYEIVHREKCIGDVVVQSLLSYFKKVDQDYNRTLVSLISKVQVADLGKIAQKYVAPMFDPMASKVTVVCHPSKVEEITKGLNNLGLKMKSYAGLEDAFAKLW
ncbi:hypothetical protein GE061_009903 [Apolygus lucorum]|uniref:Presequence protease, mitochondrial n=1 Tax=Apolygus lucorum TaxID=248454 RepID=A0A6A4KHY5_APOLU|nr:hypothetical protein GE061_009903 [Apolygus lucorum]